MTQVPDIKFYQSRIYETVWWDFRTTKPPKIEREIFEQRLEEIRSRKGLFQEYLNEMTNILGIEWKRKEIEVWLVSLNVGCFSRPLTISLSLNNSKPKDIDHIIDTLTHELIHNALIEHPHYRDALKLLEKDYSPELPIMYIHILVHAVHSIVYKNKRGTHRMEWDIERVKRNPPYRKAWKVVQKEGAENILHKYLGVQVVN